MQVTFWQACSLNARNRVIHFYCCMPVSHGASGPTPVIVSLLTQPVVFGGFGLGNGDRTLWLPPNFKRSCSSLPEGVKLNDVCGSGHDCTAFPAVTLIKASIAAAMVALS